MLAFPKVIPLLAAALALGYSAAQAQVAPKPAPPMPPAPTDVVYYVDGKLSSQDELKKIDASNISYIQVLKGTTQLKAVGATSADGAAIITTKAKANDPAVLAFNKRIQNVVPLTPATPEQNAAVAAVKAYMTAQYPTAKLESIYPVPNKPDRYNATFSQNGQRVYLLFDGKGNPVEE